MVSFIYHHTKLALLISPLLRFVLSALGIFSVTPGTKDYVLGSPIFEHVRISRTQQKFDYKSVHYYELNDNYYGDALTVVPTVQSKFLDIVSVGARPGIYTVNYVLLNNSIINEPTISDNMLQEDGVLRFIMSGEEMPNQNSFDRKQYLPAQSSQSEINIKLENIINSQNSHILALTAEVKILKGF
jgi:putative alpha-1,2-mannosidase